MGAVSLCLCFHLACPLSVRSSQKMGVGALYVDLCCALWSTVVPFSAYHSVLSTLDRSSQCNGFGGYERSWTGASGRLRRRTSALCVGGDSKLGDLVSWTACGLVNQGIVGWFPAAEYSGGEGPLLRKTRWFLYLFFEKRSGSKKVIFVFHGPDSVAYSYR